MKYKIYFILISIFTPCILYVFHKMYYYYIPPTEHETYSIPKTNSDTLRIAFIGDSWAFMHVPYDSITSQTFSESLNRPVIFQSYGGCGMTSKEVYDFPFLNPDVRRFLSQGFDYCVISAGINDTYRKVSINYYTKSIDYIIRFYLTNHIIPIIIEIPDYDIERAYRNQETSKKALRKLSMLLTGTNINCKQDFRNALSKLLHETNYYNHQVHIIRYKEWNDCFEKDLSEIYLSDHMHLNDKGYAKLDSCIANTIKPN